MLKELQYTFKEGNLIVNGHVYRRPCDWAADCGPETFLGGPRQWTPAAQEALALVLPSTRHSSLVSPHSPLVTRHSSLLTPHSSLLTRHPSPLHPLRGLPDDFLVFAVVEGTSVTICGLACAATTLTVRFEDVWETLPPERRAFLYSCAVTRDPHAKDAPNDGVVRETLADLAPDVRICLDLADNGGFVLTFHPLP